MPELRQDPATKQGVIFARERAKRPHDFIIQKAVVGRAPSGCKRQFWDAVMLNDLQ